MSSNDAPLPASAAPSPSDEGSWNFKPLSEEQASVAKAALLNLQSSLTSGYSYDYGSASSSEYRAVEAIQKSASAAGLGEARLLLLRALPRAKGYEYQHATRGSVNANWFDWAKPARHLGLRWLTKRQGGLLKRLLADGCHPSFVFSHSVDPKDLPSPKACGRLMKELGSQGSNDAVRLLFNAFDAIPAAQAPFRAGVIEGLRELSSQIWIQREGVANRAEALAVLNAAPLFERLLKKKALPADLAEAAKACEGKAPAARGKAEQAEAFEFTDLQLKRQEAVKLLAGKDDAEAVGLLLSVSGLDSPAAFEAGISNQSGSGSAWRYWTSVYAHYGAYDCCSLFLSKGENPWLLAGDGQAGNSAAGNPFLWLALSNFAPKNAASFGGFAIAFCDAALRDAESRSPGAGRELCVASFEQARQSPLWNPAAPAVAAVNAAAERALLGIHLGLEAPAEAAPSEPARPRSRL